MLMTRKTSSKTMKMIRKASRMPTPPSPLPLLTTREQCRLQRISCAAQLTPPPPVPQPMHIKGQISSKPTRNVDADRRSMRCHKRITPPIKTSYCWTMLLTALILGTDCVGSEMDALKTLRVSNVMEEPLHIITTTTTTTTIAKPLANTASNPLRATTTMRSKNFQILKTTTNHAEELTKKTHDLPINAPKPNGSQLITKPTTTHSTESVEEETLQVLEEPPTLAESESLIKGFSIPTFLPPFPLFDVADLHEYAAGMATTTTTPTTDIESSLTTTTTTRQLYVKNIYENHVDSHDRIKQHSDQFYVTGVLHGKRPVAEEAHKRLTTTMPTHNLTVQMGNHAYLPCNISTFVNKTVSWVRLSDGHILTVDETSFITDQRIQAIYKNDDNELTWSLQIKYVRATDAGWYECQVGAEPKMSAQIYMQVVVPFTELIGDQSRFVKAGSKVALHCIVRGTLEPPSYIIWYHGKVQVVEDNKWGWYTEIDRSIFGNATSNQNTIGSLIIPFVRKGDSGNYTCQPSNSESVSVDLHVLSGEYSASAIMSGCPAWHLSVECYLISIFSLLALLKT